MLSDMTGKRVISAFPGPVRMRQTARDLAPTSGGRAVVERVKLIFLSNFNSDPEKRGLFRALRRMGRVEAICARQDVVRAWTCRALERKVMNYSWVHGLFDSSEQVACHA